MCKRKHDPQAGLIWGVGLVALGAGFLLAEQGILPRHFIYTWWTWWPAILLALGAVRLVRPRRPDDVGGGVSMILFGLWLFANYFNWSGLTVRTSWPIALVAAGAGMMATAIATSVWRNRGKKEESGV